MSTHLVTFPDWQRLNSQQRVERVLERSLEECVSILAYPLADCARNGSMLNAKVQVIRAVLTITAKIGLESRRLESEREKVIGELSAAFREGVPRSE